MMKYSNSPNAYINAQALEIELVKATTYGDALNALRETPSIDIVRCKECKMCGTDDCPMCNECQRKSFPTEADDYCSYGEREDE